MVGGPVGLLPSESGDKDAGPRGFAERVKKNKFYGHLRALHWVVYLLTSQAS